METVVDLVESVACVDLIRPENEKGAAEHGYADHVAAVVELERAFAVGFPGLYTDGMRF